MKECCKLIGSELYVSDNYAINGSVSDLALVRCQAEVWTWSLFILLFYSQWVLYFSMYLLCALFFVDGYFIGISLKWIEARTFCFADAMTVNIAQMVEISCIFCLCILLPCWSIVVLKIKYSWILNPVTTEFPHRYLLWLQSSPTPTICDYRVSPPLSSVTAEFPHPHRLWLQSSPTPTICDCRVSPAPPSVTVVFPHPHPAPPLFAVIESPTPTCIWEYSEPSCALIIFQGKGLFSKLTNLERGHHHESSDEDKSSMVEWKRENQDLLHAIWLHAGNCPELLCTIPFCLVFNET